MTRNVLLLTFLLLFYGFAHAGSKQVVKTPAVMNSPAGYFDPQIEICNSTDSDDCKTFREGDCKYVFPTYVKAYSKADTRSKICARQVSVCGSAGFNSTNIGCIKIPAPPPGPVFYDTIAGAPTVNIVPVNSSSSSYAKPRIGVVIGKFSYFLDVVDGAVKDVRYGQFQTKFSFLTNLGKKQVCASYLGYGGQVKKSDVPKLHHCFDRFGQTKPRHIDYEDGVLKIGYNPDNVHSKEIYPKIVLSKSDLAACAEYKCNIGDFAGGYVCKKDGDQKNICNGGGFTASTDGLKCENGSDLCPEDYVLDMQYLQDNQSNMVCLDGWKPDSARYVMVGDRGNRIFEETRNAFLPYKEEKRGKIDTQGDLFRIEDASQEDLNKVSDVGGGVYDIDGKRYIYSQINYFCKKTEIKDGFCQEHATFFHPESANVSEYASTPFTMDFKPFFLPQDDKNANKDYRKNICGKGFCYLPPNLYAEDLCAFKNKPVNCKVINGEDSDKGLKSSVIKLKEYAEKCDFIRFDAIGGGDYGYIKNNTAYSGGSGAYARASLSANKISLQDYNVIYTKVGLGGKSGDDHGQDTYVYLSKLDEDMLEKLNSLQSKTEEVEDEEISNEVRQNNDNSKKGKKSLGKDECDAQCQNQIKEQLDKNAKLVLKAAGGRPDGGANSFAQDSDFDLFYVRDLQSVVGKNGKEPDTPVPSLFVEDIDSSYIGYEDCKTFTQHKFNDSNCRIGFGKDKKFFGMGGCASVRDGRYFDGKGGAVRITCEKWRN